MLAVTPTNTFTYVYDESWKDQLKSFNGQAIEHDQAGVDVNVNGWGAGLAVGTENTLSLHLGNWGSLDISMNLFGRLGFKLSTKDINGAQPYHYW